MFLDRSKWVLPQSSLDFLLVVDTNCMRSGSVGRALSRGTFLTSRPPASSTIITIGKGLPNQPPDLSFWSSLILFVGLLLPQWVIVACHHHAGSSISSHPAGHFSFGLLDELDVRLVWLRTRTPRDSIHDESWLSDIEQASYLI